MQYLVVIRPTEMGFEAFVPDIDECVARARTRDQVERQIRAVVEFHVTALRHSGRDVPVARAIGTHMKIVAGTFNLSV